MKKNYMKPEAKAVVMSVNENIALSLHSAASDNFGVYYRPVGDTLYIYTSNVVASQTGNKEFDMFYDLVAAFVNGVGDICSYDPDET
jgi:hypothetical protein